jgi:translation initiation factor 1
MTKKKPDGIVYSTNPDFKYHYEGEEQQETMPATLQSLRIWLEKNHRGGKLLTVIKGFIGSEEDIKDLARKLKTSCGTGGSAKEGDILLQGDFRDKVLNLLTSWGYPAKKAGG